MDIASCINSCIQRRQELLLGLSMQHTVITHLFAAVRATNRPRLADLGTASFIKEDESESHQLISRATETRSASRADSHFIITSNPKENGDVFAEELDDKKMQ